MRKLIVLTISLGLFASYALAEFDNNSFRMQGLNPQLAGIVADEYTDWQANPADILSISGQRFYTLFSNLNGKGDQLFSNTAVNNNFQFGWVGHPAPNLFLPTSQLGFLFHQGSAITPGNAALQGTSDVSNQNVTIADVDADGTLSSTGDTTTTVNFTGEREIETNTNDIQFTYGHGIGDFLDLGLMVDRRNTETEEPINTTYSRSVTTVGTPYPINTESNTQNAKEEITTDDLRIILGGRINLSDRWNIGATVGTRSYSDEQKKSSVVTYSRDRTTAAGVPATFTATGTDASEIAAIRGTVDPAANFNTADGTTELQGAGITWTNGNLGGGLTGITALNNATIDPNAVGSIEADGSGTQYGIDTYFTLAENVVLFGAITMNNNPFDLSLSATNNQTATVVDDALAGASDVRTLTKTETFTSTGGDAEQDIMAYTVGIEQDLPGNVKLGYGAIYTQNDTNIDLKVTRSLSTVSSLDATGDGLAVGQADAGADTRTTVTQTTTNQEQTETDVTTYQFPIGLELQPFKKLKLRMGVTHQVQETVTKTKVKVLTDTGVSTLTEIAGVAPATVIGTAANPRDVVNYTDTTAKVRTTNYFYGAGYQWSENLSFDVLNFTGAGTAASDSILHLGNWRIGATLIFGGAEEEML
ncbi:MAG: hypothetical protein GF384_08765 [Elusimicrobia bacterium]|nr:hypothetical protein [Elusimicrobiota bacterium]MBD3412699.1 hypothetical protein [Elusimicrobiota bacterium]